MSETYTPAAPAEAPAAPANEVAVDVNKSSSPAPVGAQAPDMTPAERQQRSLDESLDRAFAKGMRDQEEGERRQPRRDREAVRNDRVPAAEARLGHNKPPEETKSDRKPEQSQTAARSQPYREGGRFARAPEAQVDQAQSGQPRPEAQDAFKKLPMDAPYRLPLRRMSDEAKHAWADTPEPMRAAVHKLNEEFSAAFKQYKEDYDAYQPLKPYADLAKQQGVQLDKALGNYIDMEYLLRSDIVTGFDRIVNNLNMVDPETGQRITSRDVAYHILNMTPDQHRMIQQGNQQTALHHQIAAQQQRIAQLEQSLHQMHSQQQRSSIRAGVDQFAETHPRFDEISDIVTQEVGLGFPLEEAYRRAELLRPATQAAQTRDTSAQTRQTNRSISGSPDGGLNGRDAPRRKPDQPRNLDDSLDWAIKRVQGGRI